MKIEKININEIIEYSGNTKEHPEWQIEQIKNSIQEFGFNDPIAIDEKNIIIEGHGRYLALKELGYTEVEVIRLNHLTEEQKTAYAIAHNKLTMNTEFDIEKLQYELNKLEVNDFDLDLLGFDEAELEEITEDGIEEAEEDGIEIIEDDLEIAEPENVVIKMGDLIELGKHRVMCGDSINLEDIKKLTNERKINMVFTDPPYGYKYQSNKRIKSDKFNIITNDDKILNFMPIIKKICNGFVFVCASWKNIKEWIGLFEEYFELTNIIVWNKGGGGMGDLKHTFATDYELILCSSGSSEITGKRIGSVWTVAKDASTNYVHPTQKPVKLSAISIENTTKENERVLDLFGGSGSTLIACEQLKRKACLMELEPKWVQTIIERYLKFTGDEKIRINGKTVNWEDYKNG
jgi:nuclease|nr:MAG TPA: adenine specific DNA methyltransferase [Caudoviricetes sp.]